MKKVIFGLMRVFAVLIVALFFGGALGMALGVPMIYTSVGLLIAGSFPLIPAGALGVLLGSYTGATNYSGSIDSSIGRLMVDATSATALATVEGTKLTLSQATPRKSGTLIPEISFLILAEITAFLRGIFYQFTATFRIIFSFPISLAGGAYDPEGGSLSYHISGATAGDTIKVFSIDDPLKTLDYVEIVPVACLAGGVKQLDLRESKYIFVNPTNISRVKMVYPSGVSVEYVGDEVQEICRLLNPANKITDAGLITCGFGSVGGIEVSNAVSAEVTLTGNGVIYMVKHLLAS
jgi:hypothetical protein